MTRPVPQLSAIVVARSHPWPILSTCPAPKHNTVRAGRGDGGVPKCVCPRALELVQRHYARRREHYRATAGQLNTNEKRGRPARHLPSLAVRVRETPDMTVLVDGECRTPAGMLAMDEYLNPGRARTARVTDTARRVCERCPVKRECLAWITVAEQPAGSWQGMIAGLTRAERYARATEARI